MKIAVRALAVVIMIMFFFPAVAVKCDSKSNGGLSDFELMVGDSSDIVEEIFDGPPYHEYTYDVVEDSIPYLRIFAAAVMLIAVLILVLTFVVRKRVRLGLSVIATSFICAICQIVLGLIAVNCFWNEKNVFFDDALYEIIFACIGIFVSGILICAIPDKKPACVAPQNALPVDMWTCSSCGQMNNFRSKFCSKCGSRKGE